MYYVTIIDGGWSSPRSIVHRGATTPLFDGGAYKGELPGFLHFDHHRHKAPTGVLGIAISGYRSTGLY